MDQRIRIAISGTYSSGKTTTSQALSLATGIPRTDALTAREIVVDLLPGRRFQEMSAADLLTLGLRRFEERVQGEAMQAGSFISDGSVLHEWIYGEARVRLGLNPGAPLLHRAAKRIAGIPYRRFFKLYMEAYGALTKDRATRTYDVFVHLPLEFEMDADGHRPVSEAYRQVADRLLLEALEELEIPFHVVGGTVHERVARIVDVLNLPVSMPVDEAVATAAAEVARSRDAAAERYLAAQGPSSGRARVRAATRY
jgi:nicotinamide riboside kinase